MDSDADKLNEFRKSEIDPIVDSHVQSNSGFTCESVRDRQMNRKSAISFERRQQMNR